MTKLSMSGITRTDIESGSVDTFKIKYKTFYSDYT